MVLVQSCSSRSASCSSFGCHPLRVEGPIAEAGRQFFVQGSGTGNARVYTRGCLTTLTSVDLPPGGSRDVDVTYASLVADTNNAGNLEVTAPASAGITFFYDKNYTSVD